jgi:hypothetical protein
MKGAKFLLITLWITITLISSCKKNETESNFDKSYNAWLSYKSSVNNSYNYTAVEYSSGSYADTKITIKQGYVIQREYAYYEFVFTSSTSEPTKRLVKRWEESGSSLNTHPGEGAAVFTMDDVYYQAKNVWLKAHQPENEIVFETKNDGIISSAGYYPYSCTGNCFIGINISSLSK